MKIIQTFWTAGQDPLKHSFGWTHPEYNLMSWALSCLSLREHYDEVELYTDSAGYHILIEVLQLPYTKTHVIFDDFQCLPHHWALSKIKTYSLQTEPFLHIDGDIYLPRPLPERILNAPLVAQNREIGTKYYRQMMDEGVLKFPSIKLPEYIENCYGNNVYIDETFRGHASWLTPLTMEYMISYQYHTLTNSNNAITAIICYPVQIESEGC